MPAAVLIVPRRNQGPIVQIDLANGIAFSVQYAGFGATREATRSAASARAQPGGIREALQNFDVGSQNFAYADVEGNIAYYTER